MNIKITEYKFYLQHKIANEYNEERTTFTNKQ